MQVNLQTNWGTQAKFPLSAFKKSTPVRKVLIGALIYTLNNWQSAAVMKTQEWHIFKPKESR